MEAAFVVKSIIVWLLTDPAGLAAVTACKWSILHT
jgi:hypothetical protein